MQAYHKAGVREYWLIDARGMDIEFRLFVWTEAGYQAVEPRADWFASSVFNREFRLTRSRNRVGHWQYELQQRHPAA
jgi:Uma2 family endonuclease